MSNAFAIAGVTAAIKGLLERALIDAKAGGIVDANAVVAAQAPDRIQVNDHAESRLNLYLYEVQPNSGWANERLASRDPQGDRTNNPYLALDLSYLLSAYGVADLEAEILLGHGMQALHETPGLSRAAIRAMFDPGPPDGVGVLPRIFRQQAIQLADQIESIKISPKYLKLDEISKLWTTLQSRHRPSMAYLVTAVLIEAEKKRRSAPPVLSRGAMDRGPVAQPNLLPPFPTLLMAEMPAGQPAVKSDGMITLYGHHLAGTSVVVRFGNPKLGLELVAQGAAVSVAPPQLAPQQILANELLRLADARVDVDLAQATPADGWAAGTYVATVELIPAGEVAARTSNALAVAVAPGFAVAGPDAPVVAVAAGGQVTITLTTAPRVLAGQKVSLVLGDQELPAGDITAPTNKLKFEGRLPAAMTASGQKHLARLRVDGVESLYIRRNPPPQPPEFDPEQRIVMP
jgi:hypothetical protein